MISLWGGVNFLSIKTSLKHRFFLHYNRWLFKKNGIKYGRRMYVFDRVYLKGRGDIVIGDNFTFTSGDCINPICRNIRGCLNTVNKGVIMIGDNVGISSAILWSQTKIQIGNYVNIGGNCLLIDNDAHPLNFLERRKTPTDDNVLSKPIIIEDDVWIGANSIILKGVTIGARSIVGAGSVVTKSFPSDSIIAGNPAKLIKTIHI